MRARADHSGQLGLDQRLIDGLRRRPDPIVDISRLERLEHLDQCRMV
jgi:hypothetical protein